MRTKKIWRPCCKTEIGGFTLKEKKEAASGFIVGHRTDLPTVERPVGGVVVLEEEHVDEGDEEAGCHPGGVSVVCHPLVEDQDDQVAKEAGHEDDLGDEAHVDVKWLVKVPGGRGVRCERGRGTR